MGHALLLLSSSSWSVVELTEEAFVNGERASRELVSVLGLRVSIRDREEVGCVWFADILCG